LLSLLEPTGGEQALNYDVVAKAYDKEVLSGFDAFRSDEGDDFGGHTTAEPLNRESARCAEN